MTIDVTMETGSRASSAFDVIVVGGGPAGLSAALILGRSRRSVLVCHAGEPAGPGSRPLHGFLSRDGTDRAALLATAREELGAYSGVDVRPVEVVGVRRDEAGFEVETASGDRLSCRRLLLATGVAYAIPTITGMRESFGRGVLVCPTCDAWEVRDEPLAVYGPLETAADLAVGLSRWSSDVLLLTDGREPLAGADRDRLARHGVWQPSEQVVALELTDGNLCVRFAAGGIVPRRALFLATRRRQRSPLVAMLGCTLTAGEQVETRDHEAVGVRGVFVAGDASRHVGLAIAAAADGALAGAAIDRSLSIEDVPGWRGAACCGWEASGLDENDGLVADAPPDRASASAHRRRAS